MLKPGRTCCVHLVQLTAMKSRDGWIGLKDYRGKTIEMMTDCGWDYAGEVTIDKNPQVQATRNKDRGLLFKSLATDSSVMRMALADYVLYFRRPGENPEPIKAGMSSKYNPGGGGLLRTSGASGLLPSGTGTPPTAKAESGRRTFSMSQWLDPRKTSGTCARFNLASSSVASSSSAIPATW